MTPTDQEYLQRCRALLRIDRHTLDDALEVQAEYQEEIGRRCALLEHQAARLKEELVRTEARLIEDFRDERSTKDLAEAKAKRHPDRRAIWERHQDAVSDLAEYANLLDAWKARAKDIQALGKLFGDQYWARGATSVTRRPQMARRDYSAPEPDAYLEGILHRGSKRQPLED